MSLHTRGPLSLHSQEYQHPHGLGLLPHFTSRKNLPGEGMWSTQDCPKPRWIPHCILKLTGRAAILSWASERPLTTVALQTEPQVCAAAKGRSFKMG